MNAAKTDFEVVSEEIDNNPPLVIYHAGCVDGIAAAGCIHEHAFGDNAEYVMGHYGVAPPYAYGRDVYLVDFCYPLAIMEVLATYANKILLMDHHKDLVESVLALKNKKILDFTDCGGSASGASLAWDFCQSFSSKKQKMPLLLEYVRDYDLYNFRLDATRDIITAITPGLTFLNFYSYVKVASTARGLQTLIRDGAAMGRYKEELIRRAIGQARFMQLGGCYNVPIANAPSLLANDTCDALRERYPDSPIAGTYYDGRRGRHFSLRSQKNGDSNVAAVAKLYGGNGHASAAGFVVGFDHPLVKA